MTLLAKAIQVNQIPLAFYHLVLLPRYQSSRYLPRWELLFFQKLLQIQILRKRFDSSNQLLKLARKHENGDRLSRLLEIAIGLNHIVAWFSPHWDFLVFVRFLKEEN